MYCPKEWIMASTGFSNPSWNNMSGWLSPRACFFKSKPVTPNRKSISSLHLLTPECSTGLLILNALQLKNFVLYLIFDL